ncbi:MAG: flagellar hook assembly protein FlgD [Desulfovibrio sp.]|nr:flagellar hook assembly protein FlgD [Desulfovibrio sp.]
MSISSAITQVNNEFSAALASQDKGSNLDKDSFLLLMVTQLKYQDPLNPMEDTEYIAQLAQFSSLEQLTNLNTGMESLTAATNNQQMINATSYIGKQVSISGNSIGMTTTNGVTSVSSFRYAFNDTVVNGYLSVKDAAGNTVYAEELGLKSAGTTFEFNWNGRNLKGEQMPDGVYTVNLAAYNSSGEAVLSDQVVDATVTGVVNEGGTVYIGLDGGQLMPLADVRQVTEPKVVSNGTTSSGSSSADDDTLSAGDGSSSADSNSTGSDSTAAGSDGTTADSGSTAPGA